MILTHATLEGLQEPQDWLKREIEYAIALGRNVVPILVDDFRFDDTTRAHLPETLRDLPRYNGLSLHHDYFDAAMERLRTRFLKEPAQGVITPAPPQDAPVVQQKIAEAVREAAPTIQVPAAAPTRVVTQYIAPQLTNSIGMEFVLVAVGTFLMGSNDGDSNEKPVHTVRISQPFYLGKYAVTQGQWVAVMGANPRIVNPHTFTRDRNRPIERVSWEDVQDFIQRLNAKEGGALNRLPTEAEWEYACRAGSTTAYSFGDDPSQLGEYAWYDANSDGMTHPVGQRAPNAWGLYDMHGNVLEWVQDWSGKYAPELVTDPPGPASGSYRVPRGGSFRHRAESCRSADRFSIDPGIRLGGLGFRLLRTAR